MFVMQTSWARTLVRRVRCWKWIQVPQRIWTAAFSRDVDTISSSQDSLPTVLSGQFWLPSTPMVKQPGKVEFSKGFPLLQVAHPLTSSVFQVEDHPDGNKYLTFANPPNAYLIHGTLADGSAITITRARSTKRIPGSNSFPGFQALRGEVAYIGAHLQEGANFTEMRFQLRNQQNWATLAINSGVSVSQLEHRRLEVKHPPGTLILEQKSDESKATVWFRWCPAEPAELETMRAAIIVPLETLLSFAFEEECGPIAVEVLEPKTNRWLSVRFSWILSEDVPTTAAPLFTLKDLSDDVLATWIIRFSDVRPLPQIIAATVNDRTVERQLLNLAAAAEGLHRRLYPNARQFTEQQVAAALTKLDPLAKDDPAIESLRDALRQHAYEPSYPARLKQLIADTLTAAPGLVGRENRWKAAIVNARIGFAHALGAAVTSEDLPRYWVLVASLRRILIIRLLLNAGVDAEQIALWLADNPQHNIFLDQAKFFQPRIYG